MRLWTLIVVLLLVPAAAGQNETGDNGTQGPDGPDAPDDPERDWTVIYAVNGLTVLALVGAFVYYARR